LGYIFGSVEPIVQMMAISGKKISKVLLAHFFHKNHSHEFVLFATKWQEFDKNAAVCL
jgi:hypothetical protein